MAQARPTNRARSLRYLLLLVLLSWTAISMSARYLLSDISIYIKQIEDLVAEKTPYHLTIAQMEGRWLILSPVIELKDVVLYKASESAETGEEIPSIITISHLAIELDIVESLFTLSPRVKQLLVSGVDLTLIQNIDTQKIAIKGMALNSENKSDTVELVKKVIDDFIFTSEQIYLTDIRIALEINKIKNGHLEIPSLLLDNEWFNHELATRIVLQDGSGVERKLRLSGIFQGNPLELDRFSMRGFLELEKGELGFWTKQIPIPNIAVNNISFQSQFWFDVNQGVLNETRVALKVNDIEVEQTDSKKITNIQSLSLLMEVQGDLAIKKVLDKDYLPSLKHKHAVLKIRNFDIDWDDFHLNNFSALIEQMTTVKINSPLDKQWEDFEEVPFQLVDQDVKPTEHKQTVVLHHAVLSHLPLSLIKKVAPYITALESKQEVVDEASPQGSLKELQIAMYTDKENKHEVYASTYARNIGISSVLKIPAISGIDFYAELAPEGLGVELDTEDAKIAEDFNLFRKDLVISKAEANLFLERLSGDIVVHSDIAELRNDWIEASASFAVSVPERFYVDGVKELPAWSLQVNLKSIPAADALMFFPGKLPPSFLDWLDNFLLEGSVEGDIILFAFAKKREPDTFSLIDGDFNLVGGMLDYLPGKWPILKEVSGNILVHNDQVKASVPAALMFDSRLYNANVFIPSYLSENLPRVQIKGDVSGSLKDVQKLFLESELKHSLGSVVEDWVLYGEQTSAVDIDFPISDSPANYESKLEVDLSVNNALLAVPSVGLGVKELSSDVHYSLKHGLSAKAIKAKFFDKEVTGHITTIDATGDQVIQIFAEGDIDSADLSAWQKFWVFDNLQGSTRFNSIIAVGELNAIENVLPTISKSEERDVSTVEFSHKKNKKQTSKKSVGGSTQKDKQEDKKAEQELVQPSIIRVDVISDLSGLGVNLPSVYAKDKKSLKATRMQLDVFDDSMIYRLDYGQVLGVSAKTQGDDLERARIHFGDGTFILPAETGVKITGHIDDLDFDSWVNYLEKNLLDEEVAQVSTQQSNQNKDNKLGESEYDPASLLNIMELTITNFFGFDQELKDLKVKVTREPFVWRVELENDVVAGVIYVPDEDLITKDNPIVAKLNYLKITEEQFDNGGSSEKNIKEGGVSEALAQTEQEPMERSDELRPDDFSFMSLDIDNVTIDKTKHGRWQFDLFPDENGVDFKIHQLNYGLMAVNGSGRWDYREDYSATRFKGHLRTSAITKIFSALSLQPSSKSRGLMAIDIKWPGSPLDFDSDTMKGTAGLEIFDGSIVEVDINSKKFKALGIFNLGIITDVLTLKIFKKIGNSIDKALTGDEKNKNENFENNSPDKQTDGSANP